MSVNLKVTLGTVNYTDFLHVTASKVSAPSVVVWETWIDVPVTNYNFVIPGLDPENYYIRYYDAPTNVALGTLVAELLANATTNEFEYEKRFYTTDGGGTYDPVAGDTGITDPYLIGKTVTDVFKEAFRPLKPTEEYTFDDSTGNVDIINGTSLATQEKLIIEIKYATGVVPSSNGGGLYTGTLDIPESVRTLLASEKNKRCRLVGTASTQKVILPLLSSVAVDDGFYFDNSIKGTAVQCKLLFSGSDQLQFNGFMAATDLFDEFWVSKGEHVLIRKYDDLTWECILDYKGTNVGERVTTGYKGHPNILTENGQLVDGDEYPRLWWWINNILPATHKYVTDTVTGSFTHTASKRGQFAIHSTLKKFRMPDTRGMSGKGLKDFETYNTDTANRPIDYPGGYQAGQVGEFSDNIVVPKGNSYTGSPNQLRFGNGNDIPQNFNLPVTLNTGKQNRVENIGEIYARRI